MKSRNNMWFPSPSFILKHKSKMNGDCCGFEFLWRSVDGVENIWCVFQSEINLRFQILWRSVDKA